MGLLEILVTPDDGSGVRRIDSIELQDTSANPVRQYLGQCCQLLVSLQYLQEGWWLLLSPTHVTR